VVLVFPNLESQRYIAPNKENKPPDESGDRFAKAFNYCNVPQHRGYRILRISRSWRKMRVPGRRLRYITCHPIHWFSERRL